MPVIKISTNPPGGLPLHEEIEPVTDVAANEVEFVAANAVEPVAANEVEESKEVVSNEFDAMSTEEIKETPLPVDELKVSPFPNAFFSPKPAVPEWLKNDPFYTLALNQSRR